MVRVVEISGGDLKIGDIWEVAYNKAKVKLSSKQKSVVDESRNFVESVGESVVTYGVNTGFGPMAQYILSKSKVEKLQYNLIRSHAVGLGDYLSEEESVAIMVVRLNTLIKGSSGVSWNLLKYLETYINKRIVPVVPKHGSVGASGDLVQLSHIALGLIGEGKVYYNNEILSTKKVLSGLNLKPLHLESKEGLSLINGTSCMSALGALSCYNAQKQLNLIVRSGAMAYELMSGFDDPISIELQKVRPHNGQVKIASDLRDYLKTSKLIQKRSQLVKNVKVDDQGEKVNKIDDKVQDIYSIRCMPQIYGPALEVIENAKRVVEIEINSVTDNPITSKNNKTFLHGGNFHGDYISLEMDKLKIVLTRLSQTIERHINLFLNPNLQTGLPPFLNLREPGLDLSLQGLQFVATSTTAEMQTLSYPNYLHSITTNADNQDIVSMGTNSALITNQVVDGLYHVMTVYFITLAQAVDVMNVKNKISKSSKNLYDEIRSNLKVITDDRDLSHDLIKLVNFIKLKKYE